MEASVPYAEFSGELVAALGDLCGDGSARVEGSGKYAAGCSNRKGDEELTRLYLTLHSTLDFVTLRLIGGGAPQQIEFCLFEYRSTQFSSFVGLADSRILFPKPSGAGKVALQISAIAPTVEELVALLDRFRLVVQPLVRAAGETVSCAGVPPRLGGPPMDRDGEVPPP